MDPLKNISPDYKYLEKHLDKENKSEINKNLNEADSRITEQIEKIFNDPKQNIPLQGERLVSQYKKILAEELESINSSPNDLEEKSEGYFNCVGKEQDPLSGGYFYKFEIKKECLDLEKEKQFYMLQIINQDLFPAVQIINEFNLNYQYLATVPLEMREGIPWEKLGYTIRDEYIVFPDEVILKGRWSELQKENPILPNLSIISTELEDDKTFINAFLNGNIVLSKGKEFIHDQQVHISSHINMLFKIKTPADLDYYNLTQDKSNQKVNHIINSIEEKKRKSSEKPALNENEIEKINILNELLWTYLGLVVDTAAASFNVDSLNYLLDKDNLIIDPKGPLDKIHYYMIKRYSKKYLENKMELISTWNDIIDPPNNKNKNDLEIKSEGYFNCVGKERDTLSGGYFYKFEIKKECFDFQKEKQLDMLHKINDDLFPAVQLINVYNLNYQPLEEIPLKKLGYTIRDEYIVFPDEVILKSRWSELQKENPILPNLSIISSEGVKDDKSFINAVLHGDIVLSKGKEFINDQQLHIVPRMNMLLNIKNPEDLAYYNSIQLKFNEKINNIIYSIVEKKRKSKEMPALNENKKEKINILNELLWTYLRLVVDIASSSSNLDQLNHILEKLNTIIDPKGPLDQIHYYMIRRYSEKYLENKIELLSTWNEIIDEL